MLTIGYGHTAGVRAGHKITQAQADALLVSDMVKYEDKVNKYSKYNFNQNEFDAMVSFAYNVGSIDKLTAGGTRTKAQIAPKILVYNKANGKVLAGLTRRRKAEHTLFIKACSTKPTNPYAVPTTTVKKGSKGESVKWVQWELRCAGYDVSVDGIFGNLTEAAARDYQLNHKVTDDCKVGPVTRRLLLND